MKWYDVDSWERCEMQVDTVKEKNAQNPVIVYSKTYCPYCAKVRSAASLLLRVSKCVSIVAL